LLLPELIPHEGHLFRFWLALCARIPTLFNVVAYLEYHQTGSAYSPRNLNFSDTSANSSFIFAIVSSDTGFAHKVTLAQKGRGLHKI